MDRYAAVVTCVCGLLACGGDAVVASGGGGGGASASTSSAGGLGGAGGDGGFNGIQTSSGTGGVATLPCDDATLIDTDQLNLTWTKVCGWGAEQTGCAVGYRQIGESPDSAIVIEGCIEHPADPNLADNHFRLVAPADAFGVGTYTDVELMAGIYYSYPQETSVTITTVDEVGGVIEGTFPSQEMWSHDIVLEPTATLRVRVEDLAAP